MVNLLHPPLYPGYVPRQRNDETALRKERSLTQQALAELVELGITQMKRYEAGTSQPTLDVIRRLS